jgi:hypothetical protein
MLHRQSLLSFFSVLIFAVALPGQEAEPQNGSTQGDSQNCTFTAAPDDYLLKVARTRRDAYERALQYSRSVSGKKVRAAEDATAMPRRNFIDDEIFGKMERDGVQPAALSNDEDFLRRISLDLAGRIPTLEEISQFAADEDPGKRDKAIDRLLNSPEYVDKWTMWLGDLLQNARFAQNRSQQVEGRNRLHEWMRASIANGKSWRDITYELLTGNGNNYDTAGAGANFIIRGFHPMGPRTGQDTYDMLLSRSATMFLGMGNYDCILCHDGRGHLNTVSAWGTQAKRVEALRMAAFFSRSRQAGFPTQDQTNYYFNSFIVTEANAGRYDLNTTDGNRPPRAPMEVDGQMVSSLTPVYRDGRPAQGNNWRESFARMMQDDPMFARNFVNRIWKAMFTMGLAEPVDFLDPARLDPAVEAPKGWTSQASHPELLERLALWSKENDYNLRELLRLIASSSAYQLSARYEGEWKYESIPYFARRLPRRLEGEEVHDAILRATGTSANYTVPGFAEPLRWAMHLPEPAEPRSNGAANGFMNSFQRGNRDTQMRSQDGSVLMYLNLMNSAFVNTYTRVGGSPVLLAWSRNTSDEAVVDEMFQAFLSRKPVEREREVALKSLRGANGAARNVAIEDLAWALVNKVEFLFSY